MEQDKDFKTLVAEFERGLIEEALAESAGHQRRAAAPLGIQPTTLHEKINRQGQRRPTDGRAA